MEALHQILAASIVLRLFIIIGLGYLIGNIRVGRFSLGVAAVLFVGLALSGLDPEAMALPQDIATLGLVIFVYTIGIRSGAVFLAALGPRIRRVSLLTAIALAAGAGAAAILALLLHIPRELAAGLYCGGLTNTPALAAALDSVRQSAQPGAAADLTVGYSIAYPFGVIGVMLSMLLSVRLFRANIPKERQAYERETLPGGGMVATDNFLVTKTKPNGNLIEPAWITEQTGALLTRRRHGEEIDLLSHESTIYVGDIVVAVGSPDAVEAAGKLIGEPSDEHVELESGHIAYRRIIVSNKNVVGKRIDDLHLDQKFHAIVTRVRRGDADVAASGDMVLQRGDRVRVVTYVDNVPELTEFFGDSMRATVETDYLSISLGMALGVLLGAVKAPLGEGASLQLGSAGGVLIVSLFLGHLIRTGPITWVMPMESNLALRQIGLLLFLAVVGANSGGSFFGTLWQEGPMLLAAGAVITVVPAWIMLLFGRYWLKENLIPLFGFVSGAHTQPACLAYGQEMTGTDSSALAYATVLPTAMIVKIIAAQALIAYLPLKP